MQQSSSSHFPSPSSGFIPTQDEETFQSVLESRVKAQKQKPRRASAALATAASSSYNGQTMDMAFSGADGAPYAALMGRSDDKENSVPLSRTSSTASLNKPAASRRRSSAAHPLSPSTSNRRSRPSSISNAPSQYKSSSLSGSRRNSSSYSLSGANNAATDRSPSFSSLRASSNSSSSAECVPAFARMALPSSAEDSALEVDDGADGEEGDSYVSSKQRRTDSSGSGNGQKRSSREAHAISWHSRDQTNDNASTSQSRSRTSSKRSSRTTERQAPTASASLGWDDEEEDEFELQIDDDNDCYRRQDGEHFNLPPVTIRDFAFPSTDPRHVGEQPQPDPIQLPTAVGDGNGGWLGHDLSASVLSSSSSSSLSSCFTPPPFGSFGFGNPYHQPQQGSTSSSGNGGGQDWSHWGQTDRRRGSSDANDDDDITPSSTSPANAPPAGSSKYSWNFVTNHTDSAAESSSSGRRRHSGHPSHDESISSSSAATTMPSALIGSGLHIDEFEEDFRDDDDDDNDGSFDEETSHSRERLDQVSPSHRGLLYRAAYPFSAEAAQEMTLCEGDLVRVWERLNDGWVVGGKITLYGNGEEQETGESGLIPENYLVLAEDMKEAALAADDDGAGDVVPDAIGEVQAGSSSSLRFENEDDDDTQTIRPSAVNAEEIVPLKGGGISEEKRASAIEPSMLLTAGSNDGSSSPITVPAAAAVA